MDDARIWGGVKVLLQGGPCLSPRGPPALWDGAVLPLTLERN